ncbi:MAG: class I SAM-dependent methyltransferase [bacterium]|nr:class I SAM-dependent methyltransferase [bacterium]
MKEGRFAEVAQEYNKLKLAIPYYDKIQKLTGNLLISNLKSSFPENDYFLILEIGFGTGETTRQILAAADKIGVKIRIVAIDNEIEMLKVATKKIKDRRASFILAGANEFLTDQNQKYHGIVSGFMIHNLIKDQRIEIVNKVLEVLEPNGVFVNADKIAQNDPIAYWKDLVEQMKKIDDLWNQDQGNRKYWDYWRQHYVQDSGSNKMTESELQSLLQPKCQKVEFCERHGMDEICVAVKK